MVMSLWPHFGPPCRPVSLYTRYSQIFRYFPPRRIARCVRREVIVQPPQDASPIDQWFGEDSEGYEDR